MTDLEKVTETIMAAMTAVERKKFNKDSEWYMAAVRLTVASENLKRGTKVDYEDVLELIDNKLKGK